MKRIPLTIRLFDYAAAHDGEITTEEAITYAHRPRLVILRALRELEENNFLRNVGFGTYSIVGEDDGPVEFYIKIIKSKSAHMPYNDSTATEELTETPTGTNGYRMHISHNAAAAKAVRKAIEINSKGEVLTEDNLFDMGLNGCQVRYILERGYFVINDNHLELTETGLRFFREFRTIRQSQEEQLGYITTVSGQGKVSIAHPEED
ncbi:MAG TPA: hypothetical protein VJB05_03140 [archaeon]|nr:hypothetical protein [archaeon]